MLVDPEDSLPVRTICHHWFGRDIPIVFCDCKLSVVMQVFKSGRSHMALVKDVDTHEEGDPYLLEDWRNRVLLLVVVWLLIALFSWSRWFCLHTLILHH